MALLESEITGLCLNCREAFMEEPMLLQLPAPIMIFGDIHGQYVFVTATDFYCDDSVCDVWCGCDCLISNVASQPKTTLTLRARVRSARLCACVWSL